MATSKESTLNLFISWKDAGRHFLLASPDQESSPPASTFQRVLQLMRTHQYESAKLKSLDFYMGLKGRSGVLQLATDLSATVCCPGLQRFASLLKERLDKDATLDGQARRTARMFAGTNAASTAAASSFDGGRRESFRIGADGQGVRDILEVIDTTQYLSGLLGGKGLERVGDFRSARLVVLHDQVYLELCKSIHRQLRAAIEDLFATGPSMRHRVKAFIDPLQFHSRVEDLKKQVMAAFEQDFGPPPLTAIFSDEELTIREKLKQSVNGCVTPLEIVVAKGYVPRALVMDESIMRSINEKGLNLLIPGIVLDSNGAADINNVPLDLLEWDLNFFENLESRVPFGFCRVLVPPLWLAKDTNQLYSLASPTEIEEQGDPEVLLLPSHGAEVTTDRRDLQQRDSPEMLLRTGCLYVPPATRRKREAFRDSIQRIMS